MSLSVLQPSQQKLAEKLTILNDRVVGMVTRLYNIKQVRTGRRARRAGRGGRKGRGGLGPGGSGRRLGRKAWPRGGRPAQDRRDAPEPNAEPWRLSRRVAAQPGAERSHLPAPSNGNWPARRGFFWYVSGSVRREWFIWMNPTSPPLGLFILDRQVKAIEECVDDLELFHFEGGKEVGVREASAANAPGASQAFGAPPAPRNPPHLQGNPGPQASAPGRAVHCHNNRAPAAEAAGEEVTSGWLAVVGTRDPGSVLTGQTAEKELGERGGRGVGAPELETAGGRGAGRGAGRAGRPGRQAAKARGPRGSGASRTERGAERRERSEAAPKAGVEGHRGAGEPRQACSLGPPWSPSAASGAAARHTLLSPALRLSEPHV
ncbi:unnamed protein product [Rangifer tarandus platyrhynchus]|uniref:Uncharacterized protein n=1 Tax=Rangifer tarandus platyrhynchus TaxID=3082113 RepID=A0ABN8Y7B5_RANTA|nr:unnamed protein product [Rangifer tarandus platyrhynchus]